jgi:hypothetical protein
MNSIFEKHQKYPLQKSYALIESSEDINFDITNMIFEEFYSKNSGKIEGFEEYFEYLDTQDKENERKPKIKDTINI